MRCVIDLVGMFRRETNREAFTPHACARASTRRRSAATRASSFDNANTVRTQRVYNQGIISNYTFRCRRVEVIARFYDTRETG